MTSAKIRRVASFKEAGVTGNAPQTTYMVTGEYLSKLDGAPGRVIYDQMRRSDPQVGATLRAIGLPLRTCEYTVVPATKDAADVEIAGLIDERLKHGMTMTWDDTLRHILLMLPFGFSPMEKLWELDAQKLVMPRKLDPRLPTSVVRWEFNSDKSLKQMVQRDQSGTEYPIPIEKLAVFTTDREGDNWEGISTLRTAYKPWYIKDTLEKINAIKHDRFGVGVPRATVPGNVQPGSQPYTDTENMLERLYANEQGYIVQPEGYDIDILGGGGKEGTDALPSIRYYDEAISKAMLAMFISLGTSESGSRALGRSFFDAFITSLQAFANYIAEILTRFLLREWVDYNWPVDGAYPTIKAGQIREIDYLGLSQLISARAITPDLELENALRLTLKLPTRLDARPTAPVTQPTAGVSPDGPQGDQQASPSQEDTNNTRAAASETPRTINLADASTEEKIVDLGGTMVRLSSAEQSLRGTLKIMRDQQARDVAAQLAQGKAVQNVRVLLKKEMYDALASEFSRQRKLGREDVLAESRRQRSSFKLADPAKKRPGAQRYYELGLERISLDVEGASEKLKTSMAQWAIDLKQSGLEGDALRNALMAQYAEMPTMTWDTAATGAVNRGWGAGRQDGLEAIADEISYCYYSIILDAGTCEKCIETKADPDSDHYMPGDARFIAPNPLCLGNGKCRCFEVGVLKSEQALPGGAPFIPGVAEPAALDDRQHVVINANLTGSEVIADNIAEQMESIRGGLESTLRTEIASMSTSLNEQVQGLSRAVSAPRRKVINVTKRGKDESIRQLVITDEMREK